MKLYIVRPESAFEWAKQAQSFRQLARDWRAMGKPVDSLRCLEFAITIEKAIRNLADRCLKYDHTTDTPL